MRWLGTFGIAALCLLPVVAQEKTEPSDKRYGLFVDLRRYPQATPKETLASVVQAIVQRRFDYLLAHLGDPAEIDEEVRGYGGDFDKLVAATRAKFTENPDAVKDLQRFLKEAEWEGAEGGTATARLKDVKDRQMVFRKAGARWYLQNRKKAKTAG
jgi:hypothetical protein